GGSVGLPELGKDVRAYVFDSNKRVAYRQWSAHHRRVLRIGRNPKIPDKLSLNSWRPQHRQIFKPRRNGVPAVAAACAGLGRTVPRRYSEFLFRLQVSKSFCDESFARLPRRGQFRHVWPRQREFRGARWSANWKS